MLYSYHFSPYGMYPRPMAFIEQTTAKRSSDAKKHLELISGAFVMSGGGRIVARVLYSRTHPVRRQGRECVIDDRLIVAGYANIRSGIQHSVNGGIGGVNDVSISVKEISSGSR